MNKLDLELEQFMKLAERVSHRFKHTIIEWSPHTGMWIYRRWLLAQVQKYLLGNTRDSRNLLRNCTLRDVKDPQHITEDELRTEF